MLADTPPEQEIVKKEAKETKVDIAVDSKPRDRPQVDEIDKSVSNFKPFNISYEPVQFSDDDHTNSLVNGESPKSSKIQADYLEKYENHIGTLAQLDQYYKKANNYDVLDIEQKLLDDTITKTELLANNYIERVVAEQIVKNADTANGEVENGGRSYKWGSTRLRSKKVQEEEDLAKEEEEASKAAPVKRNRGGRRAPGTAGSSTNGRSRSNPKRAVTSATAANEEENAPPAKRRRRRPAASSSSAAASADSKAVNAKKEEESKTTTATSATPSTGGNVKGQRVIQKQYDNTFIAIWKDLSRKDGPKVSRLFQQSNQAKLINLKKTAILAAREAKRWQLKNNKNQKDLTTKARRAMREMFNFWKRNERVERELRKKHEKELIDKAKKEEEDREAKRQARKLNFLITQTELYSHFIGKKIKTDEIEGADSDPQITSKNPKNSHYDKYEQVKGEKVTEIHSIDFDNEDEEALNQAAAANAQNALQAAQDKAKSFDKQHNNDDDTNGDEMNFQNPTLMGDVNIKQPQLLKCTLKEYQVKGLNWLANLYEQGINGILADEMGLGKTVQSISVLSYLAEHHNIWGPFLVVTPASTLHNWQQEITKFVPDFKVLPYWGNGKDRKILRKFWDRKNVRYGKDAPFHVMVTSYQLVVADVAYFQKMKWQYMILDEAQAIKSSSSSRWKSLLSFQCRNRLLLTGTPIQNSMQELWALLHFIMPSLFDSHDEFSDWFSKDIESHAQSNTQLNEQQLRRLHMILKPFMLRRIKKNVQSELGDKVEIDLFCDLTNRQKKYYQMLKSQISVMDLLEGEFTSTNNNSGSGSNNTNGTNTSTNNGTGNPINADGSSSTDTSLMNLVMQFRKVCNHPDLFERADVKSPFLFGLFGETSSFLRESNDLECYYTLENSIKYELPRLVFDEILQPTYSNDFGIKNQLLYDKFSIYNPENVQKEDDGFGWLKFVDTSAGELKKLTKKDVIQRAIHNSEYTDINYEGSSRLKYLYDEDNYSPSNKLLLIKERNQSLPYIPEQLKSIQTTVYEDMYINVLKPAAEPNASAPPIELSCPSQSFKTTWDRTLFNTEIRSSLVPLSLNEEVRLLKHNIPLLSFPKSDMLPTELNKQIDYSNIRMPSMNRFITESGKLAKLDSLLNELKANDHRVLVYFQMTKMMDLMEEYLTYRQHMYIRLDGSSKLDDRRDLVHDWQSKPEIFVFLLSTRAGGLGINLTAADTVIFYDSDWNPTIDSQAMDRAHRLGQTRQVTVYRLLTRGTIEERMRNRAKQKEQVQQVVMEGKAAAFPKEESSSRKKDVAFLLMDEEDDTSSNIVVKSSAKGDKNSLTSLEEMYHEGEGKFSGTVTPML